MTYPRETVKTFKKINHLIDNQLVMKYTELTIGDIYFVQYPERQYIFRAVTPEGWVNNIDLKLKSYFFKSGNMCEENNQERHYGEATQQEKEHFLQCEKAGKYVEYKPEKIETLIFN